jgi:pyruvate,water dikinase
VVETTDMPTELRNRYSLTDADVEQLAKYARSFEAHYGRPMDIGVGQRRVQIVALYLQAQPETVKASQRQA